MPIQSTAAGLNKLGIAEVQVEVVDRLRAEGIWCWPQVSIHDELILEVEEGYGELVKYAMMRVFGQTMTERNSGDWVNQCRVEIEADAKTMIRWEK